MAIPLGEYLRRFQSHVEDLDAAEGAHHARVGVGVVDEMGGANAEGGDIQIRTKGGVDFESPLQLNY